MSENSKIEWTDHTFNPWVGCEKISPGCEHCYAESWAKRAGSPHLWNDGQRRRTTAANWRGPLKWDNQAKADGARAKVFCASLADVFDNVIPDEWRTDLFLLIRATPHLDWLLLTKRIGNARHMLPPDWGDGYQNVWLGATVVNQEEAGRDIPKLLATPARVRFLSCEPLLQALNLHACLGGTFAGRIDWIIVGGESGGHARPMEVQWAQDIRRQCGDARVAFFMKQGSAANWPNYKNFASFPPDIQVRQWPGAA